MTPGIKNTSNLLLTLLKDVQKAHAKGRSYRVYPDCISREGAGLRVHKPCISEEMEPDEDLFYLASAFSFLLTGRAFGFATLLDGVGDDHFQTVPARLRQVLEQMAFDRTVDIRSLIGQVEALSNILEHDPQAYTCFRRNRYRNQVYQGVAGKGPLSLKSIWQYAAQGKMYCSPLVHGDSVYVASFDHHLYVLDKNDGTLIDRIALFAIMEGTPFIQGDYLFIGDDAGNAVSLDITFHQVKHVRNLGAMVRTSPLATGDAVFFGTRQGTLHALSQPELKPLWKVQRPGWLFASPCQTPDNDIFCLWDKGQAALLDAKTGRVKWQKDMEATIRATPAVSGNHIFVLDYQGRITVMDGRTGDIKAQARDLSEFFASPCVDNDQVVAAGLDGRLYAFAFKDNTLEREWSRKFQAPIVSSPVIVDNAIVVMLENGALYLVDRADGRIQRRLAKSGMTRATPCVDGLRLYTVCHNIIHCYTIT